MIDLSHYDADSAVRASLAPVREEIKVLDTRVTITIPFPSYIPRARGIHAVGKFGTIFKAKCSLAEKEVVQQAADKIGISPTELIRWSAVHVAKEILNVPVPVPEPQSS